MAAQRAGEHFAETFGWAIAPQGRAGESTQDAESLLTYFRSYQGRESLWKWEHYFDAYDRHLSCFVGKPVVVCEVGVLDGGSLVMWRDYFGENARIVGVDVNPACLKATPDGVEIHIGDQADPEFWAQLLPKLGGIDVFIDDGGHRYWQQKTTFEAVFGWIRPGGVYICEDVIGRHNSFGAYLRGFAASLNAFSKNETGPLASRATRIQQWVKSVSLYPYVVVVEKRQAPVESLIAPRRGFGRSPV